MGFVLDSPAVAMKGTKVKCIKIARALLAQISASPPPKKVGILSPTVHLFPLELSSLY